MKIFISHSSNDKKFVRLLKDCLVENSIETWLDEDMLDFGDSLVSKLENALDETSHLVIVLSPASIESDWVKYELNKALKNQSTGLLEKIIPIKYRECKIPDVLSDLLYADLSNEIVLPTDSNKVKFISSGFETFFLKLIKGLKNSAKAINSNEKKEILSSIKSSEVELENISKQIHRGIFELIGYSSIDAKQRRQKKVFEACKNFENEDDIRPILLPPCLKPIYNPQIGEKIIIENIDPPFKSYGHFAGFRIDDLRITTEKNARIETDLKPRHYYQVEVNPEIKTIKFVNKIK